MSEIISVSAREILDSRGNPTIEVDVVTGLANLGRADRHPRSKEAPDTKHPCV